MKIKCEFCGRNILSGDDADVYDAFVAADMAMGPSFGFDYGEANDVCECEPAGVTLDEALEYAPRVRGYIAEARVHGQNPVWYVADALNGIGITVSDLVATQLVDALG